VVETHTLDGIVSPKRNLASLYQNEHPDEADRPAKSRCESRCEPPLVPVPASSRGTPF